MELPVQSGDLVLFARPCLGMDAVSAVICLGAKSIGVTNYDHIGIVVELPETNERLLLEANAKGVTLYPLEDRIKRTKASHVAVRKLLRLSSADAATARAFNTRLYHLAQEYAKASYNHSLSQMSHATLMSYWSHNTQYVRDLRLAHHFADDLQLVQQLLSDAASSKPSDAQQGDSTHIIVQACPLLSLGLRRRQAFIEAKLILLDKHINAKEAADTSTPLSDRYYCSQLVAETLMQLNVLHSDHRHAHQYIPADFSSTTSIKALYGSKTQSTSNRSESESESESEVNEEQSSQQQQFAFSCDFVFDPKAVTFVDDKSNKQLLMRFPLLSNQDKGITSLALHVNDCIPLHFLQSSVTRLSSAISSSATVDRRVGLSGHVRVLAGERVVADLRSSTLLSNTDTTSGVGKRELSWPAGAVDVTAMLFSLQQRHPTEQLLLQAYNGSSQVYLSTDESYTESTAVNQSGGQCDDHRQLLLTESLRQAWLGFHRMAEHMSAHSDMTSLSASHLFTELLHVLGESQENFREFHRDWQELREILGAEIEHVLESHLFPHQHFDTVDHFHEKQSQFAMKNFFYLLCLYNGLKQSQGEVHKLLLPAFRALLSRMVIDEDRNQGNALHSLALRQALSRLEKQCDLSSSTATSSTHNSFQASSMLLLVTPLSLLHFVSTAKATSSAQHSGRSSSSSSSSSVRYSSATMSNIAVRHREASAGWTRNDAWRSALRLWIRSKRLFK